MTHSKVLMPVEGHHRDDLIFVPECCDQVRHIRFSPETRPTKHGEPGFNESARSVMLTLSHSIFRVRFES